MGRIVIILSLAVLVISCKKNGNKELLKNEIFQAEKSFEKMAMNKGITEAFYYFADENAVIHRENDTLIKGKENIRIYYSKKNLKNVTLNWTPDFIYVSDCGTLGYTYGKFIRKNGNEKGNISVATGIFHTVWKKQKDGKWKYLWD